MKPIQTKYKGYHFRSRLEARWAVFLDALGVTWEYEPEGFDLGEAGWYLPDFKVFKNCHGRVSEDYVWLEIKGVPPSPSEQAKVLALAAASGKMVFVGIGLPDSACHQSAFFQADFSDLTGEITHPPYPRLGFGSTFGLVESLFQAEDLEPVFSSALGACSLAKAARFEHGEVPRG